jgi:hypothetical protein
MNLITNQQEALLIEQSTHEPKPKWKVEQQMRKINLAAKQNFPPWLIAAGALTEILSTRILICTCTTGKSIITRRHH